SKWICANRSVCPI
nr:Chain A, SER-LYS-TRP-ILE-CYS-ALA-ASN-ARG-SER-VAL-CYS-PRO-ILE [Actinia tenebrosa]